MIAVVVSVRHMNEPAFGHYEPLPMDEPSDADSSTKTEPLPLSTTTGIPHKELSIAPPEGEMEGSESVSGPVSPVANATIPTPDGVPRSRYALDEDESVEIETTVVSNPNSTVDAMEAFPVDLEETSPNFESAIPTIIATVEPDESMSTTQDEEETDYPPVLISPFINYHSNNLPFGGLQNMGNTCYMNSALQMIASLDGFAKQIRFHVPRVAEDHDPDSNSLRCALLEVLERLQRGETVHPQAFKSKIDERSPLFVGYRQQDSHEFLTTLLDLIDEDYKKKPQSDDHDDDMDETPASQATTPALVSVDPMLEDQETNSMSPKKQRLDEDDHEHQSPMNSISHSQSFKDLQFEDIRSLLHGDDATEQSSSSDWTGNSRLDESPKYKLIGGRMNPGGTPLTKWESSGKFDSASEAVKAHASDDNMSTQEEHSDFSPVDDYFATEVRVCLTCDSCKYRRSHTEKYLHLSLEIGPSIGSIEEGIRSFFKPEKREIKCEKCFCETAQQTTEITKLPRALLFHLKRFIVDVSPDYTRVSYRKDQSPVYFDSHLELDTQAQDCVLADVIAEEVTLPRNSRYGIRSVVNHIGSSASCGHYTADALRRNLSTGDKKWYRFNDSYVSEISSSQAVDKATSTAYMILYELEETS